MNPLRVAALALALVGSACGGAADPRELAEDVLERLRDQDFEGFIESDVATPQQVIEVCPTVTRYSVDQSEHREKFDECLRKADFSTAEITQVLPTMGLLEGCGATSAATSIDVTITTKSAIYTFRLDDALETSDGWKLTDTLRCP